MNIKPKYKLNEVVWACDPYGSGGIQSGYVVGIQITQGGNVLYMLSSARHPCHTCRECDVWLTMGEAWAQLQKRNEELAKAKAEKSASA